MALSWTAVSGAQSYTLKRATSAAGPYAPISAGLAGTSQTDATALNGTTYYYVVASNNSLAQSADSAPVSATPAAITTALQDWRRLHFNTTADSGDAANSADPDPDGMANLLEYALGTDPTIGNPSPVLLGRSGDFLTLGFTPVADASLSYVVEANNDLVGAWTVARNYGAFTTAAPVTYTDTAPLGSTARRFLRLKVVLTP